jgi:hypothetical protein
MNIVCVKWGDKYSAEYVNKLYSMCAKYVTEPWELTCYTDDPSGLNSSIKVIPIESDLEGWWCKLDLLNLFTEGETLLFDLDIALLNPLDRLLSVKTRKLSVLYCSWKEGFLTPRKNEKYDTLYNSSIMKWSGTQGKEVYDYFMKNKQRYLFMYKGVDRFLFNEQVDVDILPTGIAYSYWKGAKYRKDTTPEKYRGDYEVCILNHGSKNEEVKSWIQDYWQ